MPYYKVSKYPIRFKDRQGNYWSPTDEEIPSGDAMVSLRDGLAKSMNNVTVRLLPLIAGAEGTNELDDLQPAAEKIYQMAYDFGIGRSKDVMVVPSIALGTAETSLLEMVSAYTTFANEGVHLEPMALTRIEDSEGNVIKEYRVDYSQEVISPETAYIMIDMMRGVITKGTGRRLRYTYQVSQDIAGKTGTTQNSADNWFVAMTPNIVMGAWVGGEDRLANWSYESFTPPVGFVMPVDPDANRKSTFVKDKSKGNIGW
jgi:penicillin-binding protein 1A